MVCQKPSENIQQLQKDSSLLKRQGIRHGARGDSRLAAEMYAKSAAAHLELLALTNDDLHRAEAKGLLLQAMKELGNVNRQGFDTFSRK